ncbi:MAG TPA: XdhC family protein [Kiritimatiellia bacterium]|nr:XdhC family protein [Kiritimatiellia bacterium]
MKSWHETSRVFAELERLHEKGESAVLATLVRLEGSSYRRPGAKLLIRADGSLLGQVSGGCLEEDLRERAVKLLAARGAPELVHYDAGADEDVLWGLGLGCNGKLDILLQRCEPAAGAQVRAEIRQRLAGREAFAIRTLLDGPEAGRQVVGPPFTDEKTGIALDDDARAFVDHLEPPPDLLVAGAGDDAIPLVRLAAEAGFRVTVVDHRKTHLTEVRFPAATRRVVARPEKAPGDLPGHVRSYAVIMMHNAALDAAWAARVAAGASPYIGLLGPRARRDELMKALPSEAHARVFGPVGLDIGAEGAEQIAVSIVAELLAIDAGRAGGFLRDRAGAIHA